MDLTRENMILMLLGEYDLNVMESTLYFDVSSCSSIEEVNDKVDLLDFDFDDFKDECVKLFNERKHKLKELNNLMFHELEELGVNLKLWELKERQKRLL